MRQRKNIIIIGMLVTVLIMVIGYAAFSTNLTINGTANIESNWEVLFTHVEQVKIEGLATELSSPTLSGTMVTFHAGFTKPGDAIEYEIIVENRGTIDAVVDKIERNENGSKAVLFEITNIKEGDKIGKKRGIRIRVKVSYDINVTSQPSLLDNELTLAINFVQDKNPSLNGEGAGELITPLSCFNHIETPEYTINYDTCLVVGKQLLMAQGDDESAAEKDAALLCSEKLMTIPEMATSAGMTMDDLANYGVINLNADKNISIITGYHCGGSVTEWSSSFLPLAYSYDGDYMDVVIPEKIDGVLVTKISPIVFRCDDLWNNDHNIISSIKIPSGITSISDSAFSYNQLTSISIPSNVTSIGNRAFYKNRLTSVFINPFVNIIEEYAFADNKIETLAFGRFTDNSSHLKTIGERAFANNQVNALVIPDGVETIRNSAFLNNSISKLEFLTSSSSTKRLKTIGESAFEGNNIQEIKIESRIDTIGNRAFYGNPISTMGSVSGDLTMDVKDIGAYAFSGNRAAGIRLGSSTRTIGDRAFASGFLISVRINAPQNLVTVGNNVFGWSSGHSDADIVWASN